MRALVAGVLLLTFGAAVAAPSVVGTWKGRIKADTSKMQPLSDALVKKRIIQQSLAREKMTVTLVLRADKSYTATASGSATNQAPDTGKWSVKPGKLILTSSRKDPSGTYKPEVFNLSADGKTLTLPLPSFMGITAKLVLAKS